MKGRDDEFMVTILEMMSHEPDIFIQLVLESLKKFPDLAVEDDQPVETKISALKKMLGYFEREERYEDCAFIRDLQKRIEDEEKRGLSSNE